MLSCAGGYVSGAAGSNECPARSVRIETEDACRIAATAAGKRLGYSGESDFVETNANYPRGCYYIGSCECAYFNEHAVGAATSGSQLLCATVATAGAPLKRRRRTDVRSACTGARACRHRGCTWPAYRCAHIYK